MCLQMWIFPSSGIDGVSGKPMDTVSWRLWEWDIRKVMNVIMISQRPHILTTKMTKRSANPEIKHQRIK